jgi:hypothetical protein
MFLLILLHAKKYKNGFIVVSMPYSKSLTLKYKIIK